MILNISVRRSIYTYEDQSVCKVGRSRLSFGSTFFLLFVNDLPNSVKSSFRLFAYDCLLYRCIHTPHDADVLQQVLLSLGQWANRWLMKFNPIKCVELTVTNKACPIHKN